MNVFGFLRRRKDIRAVVQTLRDHGIAVTGPFRRRNGTFVCSLSGCVVTEHELLHLANARKLHPAGVSELTARISKNSH